MYEFTVTPVNVTFQVNMTGQTVDPAGVFLAGSFNNWSDQPMVNQGGGVWSLTLQLDPGVSYQYKFKNGPNGWENVQAACGVPDGFGGYNRSITVGNTATLPAVCFGSCSPCVVPCNQNPNAIICDDFETYTLGLVSPQATWWLPWGVPDNSFISSDVTDEEASNGTKSMKVKYEVQGAAQGDDQLLLLGNKTTGRYSLSWKYYIPSDHAAYYNIQNSETPGQQWNLDIYFDSTGTARLLVDAASQVVNTTFEFPFDEWFTVEHIIDLDNNIAKVYVDSNFIWGWGYTGNLGGIDFYAATAWDLNYVDEVAYVQLTPVVFNDDICATAVDLTPYFGGGPGVDVTTGLFDNTDATPSGTDPEPSCFLDAVSATNPGGTILNATQWFTFTGDGNTYHIETVDCNATNYIENGDTQMAIYEGDDCGNLTEVACNEDLSGAVDFRAGLDIETEQSTNYFILIDGWGENDSIFAIGEYCIQISQLATVDCSAGAVGLATGDAFVCFNDTTSFSINEAQTVIPTLGPIYGISWAISEAAIPAGTYPPDDPSYIAGFGVNPNIFTPALANDGTIAFLPPGIYYFTPVVVAGGTNTTGLPNFLHNVDVTGPDACFFTGNSVEVAFLPELDPMTVTGTTGTGTITLTVEGGYPSLIGDPSAYEFDWTGPGGFNSSSQNLTNLTAAGNYTVVVTDPSGCTEPVTQTFNLTVVGVNDPSSVKSLSVMPNPTSTSVLLDLTLASAADVRVDVLNTLGQTLQTLNVGKVTNLQQSIDLSTYAVGTYILRLTLDGETALRRVVVQR
jgi:hypothetical protein